MSAGKIRFVVLATLMLATACQAPHAQPAAVPHQSPPVMKQARAQSELGIALRQLQNSELEVREQALERINQIAKAGLTDAQLRELLDAAVWAFPAARYEFEEYSESLLELTWGHLTNAHVSVLAASYGALSARAKAAALAGLARLGTELATDVYVELLVRNGWPKDASPAVTSPYEEAPRFPEKILPPLVSGSIAALPGDVRWQLVLSYAKGSLIPVALAPGLKTVALHEAQASFAQALPFQRRRGIGWRWEDAYSEVRFSAEILFDLVGYLGPDPVTKALLDRAQKLPDPRLALFAIESSVRLGYAPNGPALQGVAADPESRNQLFDALVTLGKEQLFPKAQRTQQKFAESDMVHWLTFPTELARAPDHIEMMKAVERDLGPEYGVLVYYVFRFKTDPPHWSAENGWMAGVSGPFRRADFPTTQGSGDTFSEFTKWAEFSAEEHVASVEELMQRLRDAHADEEQ